MKQVILYFLIFVSFLIQACSQRAPTAENQTEEVQRNSPHNNNESDNWNYPVSRIPTELRLVTTERGSLRIQLGKFSYESPKEKRPWSGWWFPAKENNLFSTASSAVSKYDRLVSSSQVVAKLKSKTQGIDALPWEGLCDAWSLASVYEEEPREFLMVNQVCLTPGDQKALLTLAYKDSGANLKNNYYGQLNKKGPQSIYNDIYPDQLHRFIQTELDQRKSPFLMDFDAGESIWTVPVYKAEFEIKKNPEDDHRVDVELLLTSPEFQLNDEQKKLNNIGQLGTIFTKRTYTYSLYGNWDGNFFIVNRGQWTGSSELNHPDYVISLPARKSFDDGNDPTKVNYFSLVELFKKATVVENCGN